jgi:membrane protein required for colicin V production
MALGVWSGYRKGFLLSVFSVIALVLGVLGGIKLMDQGMSYLQREFNVDDKILPYVSFLVIFILIVVCIRLVGNLIRYSLDDTFLGKADKFAGAALGVFRYAFSASIMLWIFRALNLGLPEGWTSGSYLLPYVSPIAPKISEMIPFFRDLLLIG